MRSRSNPRVIQMGAIVAAVVGAQQSEQDRREWIKQAVRDQAWDAGHDCPDCDGQGTVRSGAPADMIVHSMAGGLGADWSLQQVLDAVDRADSVVFTHATRLGHNLLVQLPDRELLRFQVSAPNADA